MLWLVCLVAIIYLLKQTNITEIKVKNKSGVTHIILPNQLSFLQKNQLQLALSNIAQGSKVYIDTKHIDYIDHDIVKLITTFKDKDAKKKNIQLDIGEYSNKQK